MRKVKFFKAQTYSLFMVIILCLEQNLKISTIFDGADLFTFVYIWLFIPHSILRIWDLGSQMKALTLSFNLSYCMWFLIHKYGFWSKNKNQNSVKNATIEMRPLVVNFVKQNRTRYLCRSILVFWFKNIFRLDQKFCPKN